jgi:FMN phosphatase YigB (HAD superfamily)
VTNRDAAVQGRKGAAAGLGDLVDPVCISGAVGMRKPQRRIFELPQSGPTFRSRMAG